MIINFCLNGIVWLIERGIVSLGNSFLLQQRTSCPGIGLRCNRNGNICVFSVRLKRVDTSARYLLQIYVYFWIPFCIEWSSSNVLISLDCIPHISITSHAYARHPVEVSLPQYRVHLRNMWAYNTREVPWKSFQWKPYFRMWFSFLLIAGTSSGMDCKEARSETMMP